MPRFTALIVLVFAFASLAGITTAHAHRFVSTPLVVLNMVDEHNQSIPVVVKVQRGQVDLGAGIVMPCGPHLAVAVTAPQLPAAPMAEKPECAVFSGEVLWPTTVPMRPPIGA